MLTLRTCGKFGGIVRWLLKSVVTCQRTCASAKRGDDRTTDLLYLVAGRYRSHLAPSAHSLPHFQRQRMKKMIAVRRVKERGKKENHDRYEARTTAAEHSPGPGPQYPRSIDSTTLQGSSESSSKRAQPDKVSRKTHHAAQTMPAQPSRKTLQRMRGIGNMRA